MRYRCSCGTHLSKLLIYYSKLEVVTDDMLIKSHNEPRGLWENKITESKFRCMLKVRDIVSFIIPAIRAKRCFDVWDAKSVHSSWQNIAVIKCLQLSKTCKLN